jgi:hypothetical protein
MSEASRVQNMLNEQNAWIDKLKSQIMRLELDVVGYRVRNKQLEAALQHCVNALREYEMGDDRPRGPIPNDDLRPWLLGAMDNAKKVLEGKDD